MFYAQINDEDVVVGISQLSGEVSADNMIPILSADASLLGKIWNGTSFDDPPAPNYLYLHLQLTGDGREPVGINNDGVDALSVTATFRQTADPESAVLTAVTGASWRVTVRSVSGGVYDIVDVAFVDGVAQFDYTTDNKPDICKILESDFEQIEVGGTTYTIKLVGSNTFKIYRQL